LRLDRAGDRRDDTDWLAASTRAAGARFLLLRRDGCALIARDRNRLHALDANECAQFESLRAPSFLGSADDRDHFALIVDDAQAARAAATTGGTFIDLRGAGAQLSAFDAGLFAYARGLVHWQERTRFCATCAAPLMLEAAGHRARCTNPHCGIEHFPRTDPAVIVIVSHADRCLLGRQARWPEKRFSTLAGFVEPGETLEDAVRREVFEESGVLVGECDYHSSQPWPFPASIMLGFTAQAEDATIRLGPELAEARWFSADDLINGLRTGELGLSSPMSVSYRLIEHWLRQAAGLELSALTDEDPIFSRQSSRAARTPPAEV
jgi:NAD+ diphosphatase